MKIKQYHIHIIYRFDKFRIVDNFIFRLSFAYFVSRALAKGGVNVDDRIF